MRAKTTRYRNSGYRRAGRESGKELRSRVLLLRLLWLSLFLLVVWRLIDVQIVQHRQFAEIGKRHFKFGTVIPAQRGTIYDRNGERLAVDLIHYSVAAEPPRIDDKKRTARVLARLLGKNPRNLLRKLQSTKKFIYLAHKQPPEIADSIRVYRLSGIRLEKKFSRYYPFQTYAAQVLGFCNLDNEAQAGLEKSYDKYLRGKPGWSVFFRDRWGNQYPDWEYPTSRPINGLDVQSTLDMVFQTILEDELAAGVKAHQADRGSAILMNPETGEILAMANYPGFDPNRYFQYAIERFRNTAIAYLYDPGSTFKMVSLAYMLEQLTIDLDKDIVFCENGRYRLFGKTIRDHEPYGWLTVRQVFERSSNIGVIKLARRFKEPVFYRYARDFGFGVRTGIDLPAEAGGILHTPETFTRSTKFYMGIGYEVAVTPLQVLLAYAAVANGGRLMRPYIVRRISDSQGNVVRERGPQVIRQVISPETAAYIRQVLQGVVERGTGQRARVKGLSIAGKTGTSQRWDRDRGTYSADSHVASFVGFFPAERPRFVLMVVVFNPRKGYYGSQVAAPIFRNIASRLVGLPAAQMAAAQIMHPENTEEGAGTEVLRLEGLALPTAIAILKEHRIAYEVIGGGDRVQQQKNLFSPENGRLQKVVLISNTQNLISGTIVPRLKGLTLKEALQKLSRLNMEAEVEGYGVVVRQYPPPGRPLERNKRVKLVCKPA